MTRKTLATTILLLLVAFVGALLFRVMTAEPPAGETAVVRPRTSGHSPVNITGLSFANYRGERLVSRVSVDRFRIKPRTFGVFRLKSLNEVALTGARFELFESIPVGSGGGASGEGESPTLGQSLATSVSGLANLRGVGQVMRGVADGMEINITRGGKPHFRLVAKSAVFDFRKQRITMSRASLLSSSRKMRLTSEEVVWDEKRQLFLVPGAYRLSGVDGREAGEGIAVDVDFNLLNIN